MSHRRTRQVTERGRDLRVHFALNAMPFTREIDVEQCWQASLFNEPLTELRTAVEQRASAALIAPAGSGKTVLLRRLIHQLPEARYRVHYIKVTSLGKRDLCREIAAAVGTEPAGTYPALVRRLQDRFWSTLRHDGCLTLLLLDEAQAMRPQTLGELHILTNFEMDSRLVISLLLCGQPRLRKLLHREEVEALTERLALVTTLRLLSRDEVRHYLEHRLGIVGARTMPFDDMALEALYEVTQGNLRAIDNVALKALDLAARRTISTIDTALIAEARKRLP